MFSQLPKPLIALTFIVFAITVSLILVSIDNPTYTEPYFLGAQNLEVPLISKPDAITPYIESELAKYGGKYGIYIKDLKRNKIYTHNPDEKFQSASVYKLAVMYKTYDALEKGELNEKDILTNTTAYLKNTLSSPEVNDATAADSTGNVSYPVAYALKLMITISDNYSAILLAEKLGWANIDSFMEKEGLSGFNLLGDDAPEVTAKTAGDLLEKIYLKKAVNKEASEEMLKLLLGQTVNDRIPKYLPRDVKVAHKTGELGLIRNDAGIVFGKNGDYIFVFLTETPSPENASENVALMSKQILTDLEKN